ncbi:crystal protein [Ophiostoma piceae UAMH 11346]|uniref:Crystal protein n=1 Tax=Ophiostoma piceae (strain UAMH 11346) TaxID=1262450 RepID=S3CBT6_OPHP1|nr:crystal protein [Ophiostoma piceae UAMH 11346]
MDTPKEVPASVSSADPLDGIKNEPKAKASWFAAFFATRPKTKMAIIGVLVLGIIAVAVAVPVTENAKSSSHSTTATTIVSGTTLLIDNDLQGAASNKSALIMLGPRTYIDAVADCKALGEELWGVQDSSDAAVKGIQSLLDYLTYQGHAASSTRFWIGAASDGTNDASTTASSSWRTISGGGTISAFNSTKIVETVDMTLSAFCTQSAPYSNSSSVLGNAALKVRTRAAADRYNNGARGVAEFVGNRDHNSFRFLGIRYAPQPQRFNYSTPYWNSTASMAFNSTTYANTTVLPVINATKSGASCVQSTGGSEDCLYLNIFTPYLPPQHGSSSTNGTAVLRPVLFWMHGGGLSGGSGGDVMYDGGNFASRGDVVVVTINYRLATLGYLALDSEHGGLNGNYGLADQILALDWVHDNIASFGGDPGRITIAGQSAGAASVRAMMASPKAKGKFTAAMPMSNLGGLNYGKTYSEYYTIEQGTNRTGLKIIEKTNCTDGGANRTEGKSTADAIVDCLRAVPPKTMAKLGTVARLLVIDGTYLVSDHLELNAINTTAENTQAPYALLMGVMRDDGAPFITYPSSKYTIATDDAYLAAEGYTNVSDTLFPIPTSSSNELLNLYNMSSRLSTDAQFRCIDEATVYAGVKAGIFSSAYYYEFDRSYQTSGWPGTTVCAPNASAAFPNGDPSLPYFRCHSGELYFVFGNLARQNLPLRDEGDLPFMQYVLDSFASFVRTHSPNPSADFLKARSFTDSLKLHQKSDSWAASTVSDGMVVHQIDWPKSTKADFREQAQCDSLGLGLEYYLS